MLKKLAGQTAVYGLSSIVGRFLNYLLTPLYTYQFIASDYGVVTEMYAYVAFFIVMLTFGMETAFFRFASQSDNQKSVYSTALFPIASLSLVFMLMGSLFSEHLANLIDYPSHPEYVTWFVIVIGLDALVALPMAKLRFENRATTFATINLSSIAVNVALNLFFIGYCKVQFEAGNQNWIVQNCYDPDMGVGYIFVVNLVSSSFRAICLIPSLRHMFRKPDSLLLRSMLSYSLPLLIAGIAGFTNENLDRILLKYLLIDDLGREAAMAQVGIYGACYKVSILITLFIQAYRYAAEPFFFAQSNEKNNPDLHARMMRYFVMACLVIFLGLMVNLDLVMRFVGEEFREGAKIVPVLLVANILLGVYFNLSFWYKLTDSTRYGAYIAIAGGLITILANLVLIPVMGYMGSAIATLVCYASMVLISYFLGRKKFPVTYPILELSAYALLVAGGYALTTQINWSEGSVQFVFNNLIFLVVLTVFAYRLRPKKIIT